MTKTCQHRLQEVFQSGGANHGERGARAYKGSLGAEPPAGSRGRAPGQRVRGQSPPEAETLSFWTFNGSGKFAYFSEI